MIEQTQPSHRFFGKYRGTVTDIEAATMRVKATVPAVLGAQTSGWCLPCVPYAGPNVGFCMLPPVGAGVWIEFEAGDVSRPIWTGCFWLPGEVPSAADVATRQIITAAGTLAFGDAAGCVFVTGREGVTLAAGSGSVAIGSGGVDVNNGALVVV